MLNFSNWKKILIFLLLPLFTTPSLLPDSSSRITEENANAQEVITEHNNYLENQLKFLLAQFRAVDSILEDLALIVNQDQVTGIKNKRVIIDEIKALRGIIESIQKDTYAHLEATHIYVLAKVIDGIIDHIAKSINKGFISLGAFDLEASVNNVYRQPFTPEKIEKEVEKTQAKIEGLAKNAQSVGLHWYNKIYRRIDDYVIQPSVKYRVPQRTGKAILAASIALLTWFHTDRGINQADLEKGSKESNSDAEKTVGTLYVMSEKEPNYPLGKAMTDVSAHDLLHKTNKVQATGQNRFEMWLRNLVGPSPHMRAHSDELVSEFHNVLPLKTLGDWSYYLRRYNSGLMPISALLYAAGPSVFSDEISNASSWIRKKAQQFHNFMLGGAYNKKVVEQESEMQKMEPKITFDDIIGLDHAKEVLSLIIKYIEDPERWDRAGLRPEKGYLLTGPTRTGKSYIAEALAGEIKKLYKAQNRNPDEFGFYSISASFILQNGITKILESAKALAPCVIFIDEIDLLGLQRVANKELLNEFLIAMSGAMDTDPRKQVILLAATNKPENMDDALKAPGRFGKEIPFEYPTFKYRKEYFMRRLSSLAVNTDALDIEKLTSETQGCSFEELNMVIKKAFQVSKIHGRPLTQESLELAIDTEIRRLILNDSKVLPDREQQIIAMHQAGQALMAAMLNTGFTLVKVTMLPVAPKKREEAVWDQLYKEDDKKQKAIENGKIFMMHNPDALNISTHEEKLNLCKMYLAGHIATDLFLHIAGHTYREEDRQSAFNLAKKITFNGVDVKELPRKHQTELHDKAFQLTKQSTQEVIDLMKANEDKVRTLASLLLERKTLTATEVESIIATGALPKVAPKAASTLSKLQEAVNAGMVERDLGIREIRTNTAAAAA